MAPRNSRGKQKGEKKKKKKEEKLRPVVVDITVNLPDDAQLTLKGVSTDKIIDVRRLLGMNTVTCAITSYSLSHEIRGPRLSDTVDVAALKPCILTLVQEDYDADGAEAHVRRLLDVVACTAFFGSGGRRRRRSKAGEDVAGGGDVRGDKSSSATATEAVLDVEGETSGSRPRLGRFYEFFSLAHLTPPVQCVRKSDGKNVGADRLENHFFTLEVKLCNGKLVVVEACREGFYAVGKRRIFDHNLVDLLRQCSRAFESAYGELMRAFYKRNKFGNLPYGYRANTWLVPPAGAHVPSVFPPLPTEDEAWGGHGGGLGRDGKYDLIPWAREFSFLASMPCKTVEERLIRDRRAFLAHSLYVDMAIFRAVSAIRHVIERSKLNLSSGKDDIVHFERVGDLNVTVMRDALNASCKVNTKVDGTRTLEMECKNVLERNILKGITADENSVVHDFATLGIVNVRYCGHIALVKVQASKENGTSLAYENSIMHNHTEGGANALNINSLRMLLHEKNSLDLRKPMPTESKLEEEELKAAVIFSKKVLKESLVQLINEDRVDEESLRWELGACWIQHLQDQLTIKKDKKDMGVGTRAKTELTVEGLGKPLKILKNTHKNSTLSNQDTDLVEAVVQKKSGTEDLEAKNELYLKELLSDSVFTRLKESETGLHCKSILELIDLAKKFYSDVALPKLVADFGSLDLSPVDGQTLTDFMHSRGVQMRSLGHVVELSIKLTHIQSLCIHEMVVRAFKHLLRAVIAALVDIRQMAITIAASLNLMLGVSETGKSDSAHCMDALVWQWLEGFLLKRYGWQLKVSHYRDIRKFALLRGLCQKIGLELAPRDFDFNCSNPFQKSDIVSLVPVHKQVCCLSADGRQFLESSKTALDKGKLEEAVDFGSKALARLVAVCGPFHRMTAGAYSLFAVVLYHTGYFDQAAIYQQKALDINERQLGLDHPDTMKSYGDLAVFYYRLQHTELALGYVKRALYLLHLTCGPSHPNTAATYINMAMMEEGLGNVSIALRYLHKALNCNKKLLGPDHVQTAASYHAIAVALSLMEAYTLSVQHEWTTWQILQAKLGPDDLRTQDAAAWLEYFESKVVEQKEAARNGTRKPDTTIASKGHQSLSDLLDFINPNHTYEERPAVALNKKKSGVKVKPKLNSVTDPFMKDSSSMSFNEEKQIDEYLRENSLENVRDTMASEILANTIDKSANDCKFSVFNESAGNITSEGEEGWQPVRPKSAGQVGQRVGRGKVRIEKLCSNTKGTEANIIGYEANNIRYSGRCYKFKNTTLTDGKNEDDHSVKVHYSSGYFGHTLKSMAYQVKSQPLSEMLGTVPIVDELPNPPSKPLEQIDAMEVTTAGTDSRIISGGRSPSYRDVALTSPDPQAKMQTIMPKEQHVESRWKTSANQVEGFMCNMFKLKDPVPSADRQSHSEEINSVELNDKLYTIEIGDEGFLKDIMPSSGFCGNGGYQNEDAHADGNASVPGNEDNKTVCGSGEVTLTSNQFEKGNNADSSSLSICSEIEDKFVTAETIDVNLEVDVLGSIGNENFPGKKLSASAVPFNPSAAITRGSLSPIGSPPIDQWYSNVSLHPGFASEVSTGASTWTSAPAHQPFISSPISPGILHTVQLIHPPDSEPQVQSTNFSPSNCMFYPNSMSWLSTVSNAADSVSTVAWPTYYPMDLMDHRVMPLEVNLTNRMAIDTEVDSNKTGVIFPASYGNIGTEDNLKRAENFIAEIIFSDNEQDEKDLWNNSPTGLNILDTDGNTEKELQPLVLSKECSANAPENLRSFKTEIASISNSTRGRRKGKKTLKVPMTSLSRPHEPQSFKLIYNKIIPGSEFPKSRAHIPRAD